MSILAALRDATDEIHQDLHHHPLLKPLADETITLAAYKQAIAAFSAFYAAAEGQIHYPIPEGLPNAPVNIWLAQDRADHHIPLITLPVDEISLKKLDNLPSLLGYLYVKQGSTLGGQVISKNLHRHLGLEAGKNQHFFAGYGAENGKQWMRFKDYLQKMENALSSNDIETMCATASHSFLSLKKLCDHPPR